MRGELLMAGSGGYARPIQMPFVAKRPLRATMSDEVRSLIEYLAGTKVEVFTDEKTGLLYSKVTDLSTGKTSIQKCEKTDDD